jgi:hypothetical protein
MQRTCFEGFSSCRRNLRWRVPDGGAGQPAPGTQVGVVSDSDDSDYIGDGSDMEESSDEEEGWPRYNPRRPHFRCTDTVFTPCIRHCFPRASKNM